MRSLFALVGAATIAFLGAGWYLGWYEITRKHTPDGGTLQLNINTDKTVDGIGEIGGKIKKIGENPRRPGQQLLLAGSGPGTRLFGHPGSGDHWRLEVDRPTEVVAVVVNPCGVRCENLAPNGGHRVQ
jgi:hypothetical protein